MPHIPIDQALKQRFEEEVKPRLRNELNNECGTAQFHMAFMSAGLRADWPSPAIVTWFEQARNRVAALGYKRDSAWLRDFLQNNSVQFHALQGLPHYSAALPDTISSNVISSEGCAVIISCDADSLCGSHVIINGPQGDRECIFGGLLMADGKLYGTTTRHGFENRSNQKCSFLSANILSSPEKSNSSSIVPVRAIYPPFQAKTTPKQLILDHDWALLEPIGTSSVSQNLMIAPNIVDGCQIKGAYSSSVDACGPVSIALTGGTTRRGILSPNHDSLIMDGSLHEVRLITLDEPLRKY